MKITYETPSETEKEPIYPCLMQSKADPALVVWFTHPRIGMVVRAGLSFMTGFHSKDWNDAAWTPFKGKITLEND